MKETVVIGLGTTVVLGVGMQWLARRLRLPAILLLIAAGLLAGPWLDMVDPDAIFGDALFPVVSLAVGILLFEGGLGLDLAELRTHGAKPVVRLVTVGVLITWGLIWLIAMPLFDLPPEYGALLGALLVVSGPTVVTPLLKLARPRPPAGVVLRWEGIVIDPIGATLALVVLQFVLGEGSASELFVTAGVGVVVGVAAAAGLVALLRRFLVPDDLELAVTTMFVVGAYALAEATASEAGLFATTVLGVALANQRYVQIRRITAFNEDIGVIVLGSLFVLLAARIDVDQLVDLIPESLLLVAFAVLVVRPLVAWVCTARVGLAREARFYIAAMCPRGIVAAATSALFAIDLTEAGRDANDLDAIVFLVIVGTCTVYGLAAVPLARRLHLAEPRPDGVVLVGSQDWLLAFADALADLDVQTSVIATGRYELRSRARRWRLYTAPMVTPGVDEAFDRSRTAVIASLDDEHNAVALARCLEDLPRRDVYVLPAARRRAAPGAPMEVGRRRWVARLTGPTPESSPSVALGGGGRGAGPADADEELVEVAPAATWTRRPFSSGVTQRTLELAYERGGPPRCVEVGADGQADIGEEDVVLAVRHVDGRLDLAPRRRALAAGDVALVVG